MNTKFDYFFRTLWNWISLKQFDLISYDFLKIKKKGRWSYIDRVPRHCIEDVVILHCSI